MCILLISEELENMRFESDSLTPFYNYHSEGESVHLSTTFACVLAFSLPVAVVK